MLKKYNITFYNLLFMIAAVAAIYYNGVNVMIAKYISMAIFAFLFVAAVVKSSKEGIKPIFKKWALWLALFALVNMLYGREPENWFPLEIAMPLMIAFSSTYLFTLDYEQLKKWFLPIGIILSFVAYMAVIEGIGSLTINENSGGDVDVAKNQIGPCFTSIAILSYIFLINRGTRVWERIVFGAITVLNVYPALFLGCRTALLCFFVVAIITTFANYRAKGIVILLLISFAVLIVVGRAELADILYRSFVGQRDVNDFSSLTSGRDVGIISSIEYFFKHPLFGYFGNGSQGYYSNPHVYLIYHITKWGIIGSIPSLVIYFSIFKIFYHSYKMKNIIVFALLFVAMVESLAEYAPPFGPGSCFTMTYLILGIYLKDNEI